MGSVGRGANGVCFQGIDLRLLPMTRRLQNLYDHNQAHVYFGPATIAQCEQAGRRLPVMVGRLHEREVGAPPHWSCQLAFDHAGFGQIIPWLEQHRGRLEVLVHGLTGDDLADHTRHASWLGHEATLKRDMSRC